MHALDYLVLGGFLLAHIGTTIAIGLWLNRMARREVQAAVTNVANGLSEKFPILNGLGNLLRPQVHQENNVERVQA